jgi:hypothetical protein
MSQTACFTNIFTVSDNVTYSENVLKMSFGGATFEPSNNGRPFIPFCGAVLSGGKYIPDTVANNIAHIATFYDYFNECRNASINMVQQVALPTSQYQSALYQQYLYKQTFAAGGMQDRYFQTATMIFNFWNTANPAWTVTEYYNALSQLKRNIMETADKMCYIPPGDYTFTAATAIAVDITAWKAASATFAGLLVLEFYQ